MIRTIAGMAAAAVVIAAATPGLCLAQAATGNRINGFNYQPTQSEVYPREQAAGLRPSAAEQRQKDQELEQLNRQVLRDSRPKATNNAAAGGP